MFYVLCIMHTIMYATQYIQGVLGGFDPTPRQKYGSHSQENTVQTASNITPTPQHTPLLVKRVNQGYVYT